jgi:hypothetical protein
MTFDSDQKKFFEGTFFVVLKIHAPWPPPVCSLVMRKKVDLGSYAIWGTTSGKLVGSIKDDRGNSFWIESCPILPGTFKKFVLTMVWSESKGDLRINNTLVGSTNPEDKIPDFFEIVDGGKKIKPIDLSKENENQRRKRAQEVKTFKARVGRRLVSLEETIKDLKNARASLKDRMDDLIAGKTYVDPDIASKLRALICRFSGPSYPLLQRAAGLLNLPLLVFSNQSNEMPPLEPEFWIDPSVSLIQGSRTDVAMDLDIWLDRKRASIKGESPYNNNDILRAIAEMQGAHYDPSILPLIDYLNSIELGSGGAESPSTLLRQFLLNVGQTIIGLCGQVIKKADHQGF